MVKSNSVLLIFQYRPKQMGRTMALDLNQFHTLSIDTTEHYPILPTIKYSNYLFHFKNPSR